VIEADVIKNFGFVHIDADAGRNKVNEILKELNGYELNGNQIRVQLSTSGVRQKPGMGGDQCFRYELLFHTDWRKASRGGHH
jgi:RNA-binding protein 4